MSQDSTDKQASPPIDNITLKLNELKGVSRLANNAISIINEVEIKGAYAEAVAEVQRWLAGLRDQVASQIQTLESMLPKPEVSSKVELAEIK